MIVKQGDARTGPPISNVSYFTTKWLGRKALFPQIGKTAGEKKRAGERIRSSGLLCLVKHNGDDVLRGDGAVRLDEQQPSGLAVVCLTLLRLMAED